MSYFWDINNTYEQRFQYYWSLDFQYRFELYLYMWRANWDTNPELYHRLGRERFLVQHDVMQDIVENYMAEPVSCRLQRAWGREMKMDNFRTEILDIFDIYQIGEK